MEDPEPATPPIQEDEAPLTNLKTEAKSDPDAARPTSEASASPRVEPEPAGPTGEVPSGGESELLYMDGDDVAMRVCCDRSVVVLCICALIVCGGTYGVARFLMADARAAWCTAYTGTTVRDRLCPLLAALRVPVPGGLDLLEECLDPPYLEALVRSGASSQASQGVSYAVEQCNAREFARVAFRKPKATEAQEHVCGQLGRGSEYPCHPVLV